MQKFIWLVALFFVAQLSAEILNVSPPEYISSWAVELRDNQSPESLESLGFEVLGRVGNLKNVYTVRHKQTQARYERERSPVHTPAHDVTASLNSHDIVAWAEQETLVELHPKLTITDPLFAAQWHLLNIGQFRLSVPGNDINIQSAWDAGYSGSGVQIAIVDDGVQSTHPDLAANYVPSSSRNFCPGQAVDDPSPNITARNFHGTAVAGVAMAGRNSMCGVGSAFDARGAAIRLVSCGVSSATQATALAFSIQTNDIYSNSWGPLDDGINVWPQSRLITASLLDSVTNGRNGRGNIYVWSAGNGGLADDNSNYDGMANSRFVIAVGAVGIDGLHSYYSEPGANIIVTAPSNSAIPNGGIRTSDILGAEGYSTDNCASDFGGTSSSCPLVSGIIALMLQANPALTWRDVPVILAATARRTAYGASDPDWVNNGAGYHVNHKYGFGLVDASGAVNLAKNHTLLSPLLTTNSGSVSVFSSIPDNSANGPTARLEITESFFVEKVVINVTINHNRAGDLQVVLTSPMGTRSVLATPHAMRPVISFDGDGHDGFELGKSVAGPRVPDAGVRGTLLRAVPAHGCTLSNCNSLNGAIVVIATSGTCFFDSRIKNAQNCGAVGVVFYDPESPPTDENPLTIPSSGTDIGVTIPAGYMPGATYFVAELHIGQMAQLGQHYFSVNSYSEGWPFQSSRHLGETSRGNWTVTVTDLRAGVTGTFQTAGITVYGSSNSASFPTGDNTVMTIPAVPTNAPSSSSFLFVPSFTLLSMSGR